MMRNTSLLPLLTLLLLAGCADKSTTVSPPTGTEPTASQPVANAAKTPEPTEATEEPKPVAASIPENLKHEAFQYYGLGNSKPQNMEVRVDDQTFKGTDTYELVSVEKDRAVFTTARTGEIAGQLGNETVMVTPKGIQIIGTSQGKFEGTHMIPAKLAPGTTWKANFKITQPSGTVLSENTTWKIVGAEKVSTKAGTFDALRASTTGTINIDGKTYRIEGKTWYAKDFGVVRIELAMTGDQARTVVIEAT